MHLCQDFIHTLINKIEKYMDNIKSKLIQDAGFSSTFETERLNNLVDLVVDECITAINQTPTHCAYTTYDLGMVKCTIEKTLETVKKHFG
jgi:hypothetical protein